MGDGSYIRGGLVLCTDAFSIVDVVRLFNVPPQGAAALFLIFLYIYLINNIINNKMWQRSSQLRGCKKIRIRLYYP